MTTKPQRVLPADVYDALELSAEAFGGIGAGSFSDAIGNPLCVYGHAYFVADCRENPEMELWKYALGSDDNDDAVHFVNDQVGGPRNGRIPFARWCKELNVVRGEA